MRRGGVRAAADVGDVGNPGRTQARERRIRRAGAALREAPGARRGACPPIPLFSRTIHQQNDFRKSLPLQNRQLVVLISDSKQLVNDFVGELTYEKHLIDTLCETN